MCLDLSGAVLVAPSEGSPRQLTPIPKPLSKVTATSAIEANMATPTEAAERPYESWREDTEMKAKVMADFEAARDAMLESNLTRAEARRIMLADDMTVTSPLATNAVASQPPGYRTAPVASWKHIGQSERREAAAGDTRWSTFRR